MRASFIVSKLFDKKSSGAIESKVISNKVLAKELHKPIIRKLQKYQVYSSFIDNIWGAHLTNMQLTSKFNKDIN